MEREQPDLVLLVARSFATKLADSEARHRHERRPRVLPRCGLRHLPRDLLLRRRRPPGVELARALRAADVGRGTADRGTDPQRCRPVEAPTVEHRGPTLGYRIEDEGRVLVYLLEWISGWALAAGSDLLHDSDQKPPLITREGLESALGAGSRTTHNPGDVDNRP
jgi:hypothetical protein